MEIPSAVSTPAKQASNVLPLAPAITPATGIAGAFLIISGLVYGLVGTKHKLSHTFFSCAYLTSLSITVLIIYLITPPISDAIQGAFLVAVCVAGICMGGFSLVFKKITEGLGCLLGGFCFAMWVMTFRVGGMVHQRGGVTAFIVVVSLAFYALSFTRHTKSFALMACSSFAGATAVVLGVDCFSEAGLKEFWMYIWGLNNKFFPLHTNSYPLTKRIRAEIGCVPVLFVFGLISQFKLWKAIKGRQEQKQVRDVQLEEVREDLEADVGRRVEKTFAKEKFVSEATYGNRTPPQLSYTGPRLRSPPPTAHKRPTSKPLLLVKQVSQQVSIQGQETERENDDKTSVLPNAKPVFVVREVSSDDSVQKSRSLADTYSVTRARNRSTSLQKEYPILRPRTLPPLPVIPPPFATYPQTLSQFEPICDHTSENESANHVSIYENIGQANRSNREGQEDDHSTFGGSDIPIKSTVGHDIKDELKPDFQMVVDDLFDFEFIPSGDEMEVNSIQNSRIGEEDAENTRQRMYTQDNSPVSPRTDVKPPVGLSQRAKKTATLFRTKAWTKTLDYTDEPEQGSKYGQETEHVDPDECPSVMADLSEREETKRAEGSWLGFEGKHASNSTIETCGEQVLKVKHSSKKARPPRENLMPSRQGGIEHIKRTSTETGSITPTKAPILPPPNKSARVHERNSSLPALTTTPSLVEQRAALMDLQRWKSEASTLGYRKPPAIKPSSYPSTRWPSSSPSTRRPSSYQSTGHPSSNPSMRHPSSYPSTRQPSSNQLTRWPSSYPSTRQSSSNPSMRHPSSSPSMTHPSSDPDDMTLSERRAYLQQARRAGSRQTSTASSTGPHSPSTSYTPATSSTPPGLPVSNDLPQNHGRTSFSAQAPPPIPLMEQQFPMTAYEQYRLEAHGPRPTKKDIELHRRQMANDVSMLQGRLQATHVELLGRMQRIADKVALEDHLACCVIEETKRGPAPKVKKSLFSTKLKEIWTWIGPDYDV